MQHIDPHVVGVALAYLDKRIPTQPPGGGYQWQDYEAAILNSNDNRAIARLNNGYDEATKKIESEQRRATRNSNPYRSVYDDWGSETNGNSRYLTEYTSHRGYGDHYDEGEILSTPTRARREQLPEQNQQSRAQQTIAAKQKVTPAVILDPESRIATNENNGYTIKNLGDRMKPISWMKITDVKLPVGEIISNVMDVFKEPKNYSYSVIGGNSSSDTDLNMPRVFTAEYKIGRLGEGEDADSIGGLLRSNNCSSLRSLVRVIEDNCIGPVAGKYKTAIGYWLNKFIGAATTSPTSPGQFNILSLTKPQDIDTIIEDFISEKIPAHISGSIELAFKMCMQFLAENTNEKDTTLCVPAIVFRNQTVASCILNAHYDKNNASVVNIETFEALYTQLAEVSKEYNKNAPQVLIKIIVIYKNVCTQYLAIFDGKSSFIVVKDDNVSVL